MEIERKYLIHSLPGDLTQYKHKQIEQGYLCHYPTIRIRRSNENYILTYKSKLENIEEKEDSAIIRNEVELPLTLEAYESLLKKTDGNVIRKIRYLIPLEDGLTAELDIFEDYLKGLVFVEVEFPDEEAANKFNPPAWFAKDVSQDQRFSNYYLSTISAITELGLE